jgi:hypothetical protein
MPFAWSTDMLRLILWFAVDNLQTWAALQRVDRHFSNVASHRNMLSHLELYPATPEILRRASGVRRVAFVRKAITELHFYCIMRNGQPISRSVGEFFMVMPHTVHTLKFENEKLLNLQDLQHLSGLHTLHLVDCSLFYGLEHLTQLKHLFLDSKIDGFSFAVRCQTLCNLETLELKYVTSSCYRPPHHVLNYVETVVKLQKIHTLTMPIQPLCDDHIHMLAALPKLTSLDISRSSISDAGLETLASDFQTLRKINVSGCTLITSDGLAKTQPRLTVVH